MASMTIPDMATHFSQRDGVLQVLLVSSQFVLLLDLLLHGEVEINDFFVGHAGNLAIFEENLSMITSPYCRYL